MQGDEERVSGPRIFPSADLFERKQIPSLCRRRLSLKFAYEFAVVSKTEEGTPLIEDAGKDWTGQPSGDYNSHKMHLVIIIFER